MIQKIGKRFDIISNKTNHSENKQTVKENQSSNPIEKSSIDSALLQTYYVSFTGESTAETAQKRKLLKANYTKSAHELIDSAANIAKKYGHSEINEDHIMLAALKSVRSFIGDVEIGSKELDLSSSYSMPGYFADKISPKIYKDKKLITKTKEVFNEEIINLEDKLAKFPKSKTTISKPQLSKNIVSGTMDLFNNICAENQVEFVPIQDAAFLNVMNEQEQDESKNTLKQFITKLSNKIIIEESSSEDKIHLSIFDQKARNILKNLSLGTNMFITHEKDSNPKYLIESVSDVLNNQGAEFNNLNKNNTKITVFNENIRGNFFTQKVKELGKDVTNNHILVLNMNSLVENEMRIIDEKPSMMLGQNFLMSIKEPPKNVKLIFIQDKNIYYSSLNNPLFKDIYNNFGEISFPVLNVEQTKQAFKEQSKLMKKIEPPFAQKAVNRVIEVAGGMEGDSIEKTQKLMKKIASYYVDKETINENDVKKYVMNAKDLFKLAKEGSSVKVVFDTGKKLSDILGKQATKREAEAIVRQIKKKTLGTKGAMIYPQDGTVGGGRKVTAKAIAGETKSPYIQLDAKDFSTHEVDIFGGDILSPEKAVEKVFSIVTPHAEASPHKSAVILIEDFERLVFGDGFSPGYAKAMSQLSREMDEANKKGLNILVLGATRYQEWADACSENELKFINKVEVETPSRNINARKEILISEIKKKKIKLAATTEEDKKGLVNMMAETSEGFPFVYLKNFVDKIKAVAFERGHKEIQKKDITEGYLQLTTGRPASAPISEAEKMVVTSHEWGHATNAQVMWNLAEKQNIPWRLPNKVNFITLDPRGWYGGAMYPKNGGNHEHSFETKFADIVCDYGGHSAEKKFYKIDGSWGISADIEMATHTANVSAGYMGQGHYTGKISLGGMILPPSNEVAKNIEKDTDIMTKNGLLVSDLITDVYADFNIEATKKYSPLVGTGDCLVQGDTFRQEMNDWISKQSKAKKAELDALEKKILEISEATKQGKLYTISKPVEALKKVLRPILRFR